MDIPAKLRNLVNTDIPTDIDVTIVSIATGASERCAVVVRIVAVCEDVTEDASRVYLHYRAGPSKVLDAVGRKCGPHDDQHGTVVDTGCEYFRGVLGVSKYSNGGAGLRRAIAAAAETSILDATAIHTEA